MHAEVEVAVEVALSCPQSAVFHIFYIYEFICEYVYIYIYVRLLVGGQLSSLPPHMLNPKIYDAVVNLEHMAATVPCASDSFSSSLLAAFSHKLVCLGSEKKT